MNSDFSYKSCCLHVKTIIGIICGAELAIIGIVFFTKIEHPLMICRTVNISTVREISEGRGPARLIVNEERICSTYSIFVIFVIFHGITDFLSLLGIFVQQHRLILPLLALLPFNLLMSLMFFLSAVISYFTVWPNFNGYFVCLMFLQFLLRIYQFRCGRKLYWYLQQRSENFFAPQSALLKENSENVFQF